MSLRRKVKRRKHASKERDKSSGKSKDVTGSLRKCEESMDTKERKNLTVVDVCKKFLTTNGNGIKKVDMNETKEDIRDSFPTLITTFKTEMPVVEIKIENDSEEENNVTDIGNNNNYNSLNISNSNTNVEEYFQNESTIRATKRDIFPEVDVTNYKIYELPHFQCCLIDHSYFKRKSNYFISSVSNTADETTLAFENGFKFHKKGKQQQTKDSVTKHVDSDAPSDLSNSDSIKNRLRKRSVKINDGVSPNSSIDHSDKKKVKSVKLVKSRGTERHSSNKNSNVQISPPKAKNSTLTQSLADEEELKKSDEVNRCDSNKGKLNLSCTEHMPDSVNRLVSLEVIAEEISKMEKIIQSKCELLCDNKSEKNVEKTDVKNSDVPPPKMRKLSGKENSESQKEGEYILPLPNLAKMLPEDKNWNMEYVEDDVKNLGLDDLLLRASELNAENFTKALGQNSGRNGSKGEDSDIVLTFPSSRRTDDIDGEASKGGKKAKIDFFKKYVKEDKQGRVTEEETTKKAPEVSPKKPGIKVKTVQNINEEFNDSLGGKTKILDSVSSDGGKSVFTIGEENNQKNDIFVPEKEQKSNTASSLLSCRKILKPQENRSNSEDKSESRPFIMTIIQNKEISGNEHGTTLMPGSKVFVKPKPPSEASGFISSVGERVSEVVSKKADDIQPRDVGENVTLLVSEPRTVRPFDFVNSENYVPDAKRLHSQFLMNYGPYSKKKEADGKVLMHVEGDSPRMNIPILVNSSRKFMRIPPPVGPKMIVNTMEDPSKRITCTSRPASRLIRHSSDANGGVQVDKVQEKTSFTPEQKILTKEPGKGLKLTPEMTVKNITCMEESSRQDEQSKPDRENEQASQPKEQIMTLTAFSNILKDILPDKWILSLDKRFGLQIIKTHLDELLNPTIMISVVVGRTGKVTVNVRGRQLEKSHDLFTNLCDVGNSKEKVSINYILAIINKLRFFNVCFGCDDQSLKKYWCEDGFIEYYTEFQQTYRSHICEYLVRLGKKRCYPCYRMHESLKKRKRREQLLKKTDTELSGKIADSGKNNENESPQPQARAVKRNLEEFLEESFINMKQKITDEIEKTKEDEESGKVPKTQDEVLSFMGLTRKDSLDVNLRKSKREKKGFKKCESVISNNVNKEELYFLEKYWPDINVLFSTSLLIGAYSRTSISRLREKCRMFHKLLSTWRGIIRDNPDWVGGHISLAENLVDDDVLSAESAKEKFDKMDIPALRAYIINCVKEVNKIKSRLRTKNNYFKVLYNTFVKPKMKKARQGNESTESPEAKVDSSEDTSKEESTPEKVEDGLKPSNSTNTTSTEVESNDENSRQSNGVVSCISDGD